MRYSNVNRAASLIISLEALDRLIQCEAQENDSSRSFLALYLTREDEGGAYDALLKNDANGDMDFLLAVPAALVRVDLQAMRITIEDELKRLGVEMESAK